MTEKQGKLHKVYLIGIVCISVAFLIIPYLLVPTYAQTRAAAPTLQGGSNDVGRSQYNIIEGGNYVFTGSTTSNHIRIYSPDNVPYNDVTITLDNVTIDLQAGNEHPAIDIQEETNVTIILKGKNYLHGGKRDKLLYTDDGYAGIRVHNTSEVTIIGDGSLEAVGWLGRRGAAGIGGNYGNSCGKVTIGDGIDNPTVTARGGGTDGGDDGAAGIGGGYDGQANDGITINSGTVTATGGNGAAGIGGGQADGGGSGGKAENITINGGTVSAKGGEDAAGIGGGESGSSGDGGNVTGITINGGTVFAQGGSSGAGIGGSKDAVARDITITDGDITALGGDWAAGIGGGNAIGTGGGGAVDGLEITKGTIKAYGGGATMDENGNITPGDTCGAGIGGSDKGDVSNLVIDEKTANTLNITAVGGDRGAGIGNANSGEAGNDGVVQNNIGSIKITLNGGTINAVGGYGGAGIGGGNSKAGNIEIYGTGTINATGGDHSSAIGAGKKEDGGDITIKGKDGGRNLIVYGYATKSSSDNDAAVIGGADSAGGNITISNAKLYLESPYNCSGAAIGSGSNASMIADDMGDIAITNCYVDDRTYADRNAASIGAGFNSMVNNITIKSSEVKGGSIGGTDNGNRVFTDPCIESITIADSTVTADNRHGQRAAIGSGRYEGIESITITNSTVTAGTVSGAGIGTGGYSSDSVGDGLKWTGNACGSITIEDSNVAAQGNDGGAGIGGGWGTPVGTVKITDSTVTASSGNRGDNQGGAGIGGGWCESTDDITISGSKVTATGAGHSAGIGSSGSDTSSAVMWNTTCNSISIKDGSEVTAAGGSSGAGIGTGYSAQYGSYARITISDSTVTSKGGEYGAGIGAGRDGYLGAGGESADIDIKGKSKVTATGGIGGAGIGGGYDGGSDPVTISLAETVRTGEDWKYYVKAYGGKGAAGIGSGGVYVDSDAAINIAQHGHDIDKVSVSGGYVYAKGGDDENGAGAGIGGGARGGNLNGFTVSGGLIEAAAGYGSSAYKKADDIGTGGEDNRDDLDNDFKITGGTVLGTLSSDPDIIIDGGSVRHKLDGVKRSNGTAVYQTRMKVFDPYTEPEAFAVTTYSAYGTADVFSDKDRYIYLYLPKSETDEAKAQYNRDGQTYQYYGTTKTDGSGWLKMGGKLTFTPPSKKPLVGEEFTLKLNDEDVSGDVIFTVTSEPEGTMSIIEGEGKTIRKAPGAQITLKASDRTKYTVTAVMDEGFESDMYWSAEGSYSGIISQKPTSIEFTEDPVKFYDGEEIKDPSVEYNSDILPQQVKYRYYSDAAATQLIGTSNTDVSGKRTTSGTIPKDAGIYYVTASVPETEGYAAATTEVKMVEIKQRPIVLDIKAVGAGSMGTGALVTVTAFGAVDDPGSVELTIKDSSGNVVETLTLKLKRKRISSVLPIDIYSAAHRFTDIEKDEEFTLTAKYIDTNNYECIEDAEGKYKKKAAVREVEMEGVQITYGDEENGWSAGTVLTANVSKTGTNDRYEFELLYDEFYDTYENIGKTIILGSQNNNVQHIDFENAGLAVVRVTVTDPAYEDAVAYAPVLVKRADLTVSSYAHKNNIRRTKVRYGKAHTLTYDVEYSGFVNGDTEENGITKGSFRAIQLPMITPAGERRIPIIRQGEQVNIKGTTYERVFFSRNYNIIKKPGTVNVLRKRIKVIVHDAKSRYGVRPEYSCTIVDRRGNEGLMPWESAKNAVILKVKGRYTDYAPGKYEDVIIAVPKKNGNYIFTRRNMQPGDLTVKRGLLLADVKAKSKVYDGEAVRARIIAKPVVSKGINEKRLKKPHVRAIYYEYSKDGSATKLRRAPHEAGIYGVRAAVVEKRYYKLISQEEAFRITKARYQIDTPQVPDMEMKKGLTLSHQKLPEGWEWRDGSKKLSVGPVAEYAVYTPADNRNYFKVVRKIEFEVYKKSAGSDEANMGAGTGGGSSDGSASGGGTGTGDTTNPAVWIIIIAAALTGVFLTASPLLTSGFSIRGGVHAGAERKKQNNS